MPDNYPDDLKLETECKDVETPRIAQPDEQEPEKYHQRRWVRENICTILVQGDHVPQMEKH